MATPSRILISFSRFQESGLTLRKLKAKHFPWNSKCGLRTCQVLLDKEKPPVGNEKEPEVSKGQVLKPIDLHVQGTGNLPNSAPPVQIIPDSFSAKKEKIVQGLEAQLQAQQQAPAPGGRKPRYMSLDRNFVTPLRAMSEFLLTPKNLEGMRKTLRRSAHADEPPITVYWRKDVEAKALEVWGSREVLDSERHKRERETAELQEASFELRKIMKQYRKTYPDNEKTTTLSNLLSGSGKIVITAVAINGTNFVIKLIAWILTGSHCLFAEAIHSLADTINQLILVYGIHKSTQSANMVHPYGYANMRHVASLVSGVGIFCVGAGLSLYHGIIGLLTLAPLESLYYAFFVLGGSLVSEGATLIMAVNSVRKRCRELNVSFKDFIFRSVDPAINVVIMEDSAAVAGVIVAGACMGLTVMTGSAIPDAVGSLIIGGILGGVASFIIYTNGTALVGRSIPRESLNRINNELEQDVMIRAIHDVKGIDMGNSLVRYKAEVDFDGRELTRAYLDKGNVLQMLEEVKAIQNQEELETFMLKHGEAIVDTLGAEIDRIEQKLKKGHPEIRHCDLEIL
ncbi:unnamed protein product [Allacma fusca]|uniref:Cation efflux protein transmembrane domain-containing protein n=1 Tax=Allacma fusca TaxID=39272 RepID=A0A8J2MH22_9HEXA|nr:unnamed protein product [Allacma fusca]